MTRKQCLKCREEGHETLQSGYPVSGSWLECEVLTLAGTQKERYEVKFIRWLQPEILCCIRQFNATAISGRALSESRTIRGQKGQ